MCTWRRSHSKIWMSTQTWWGGRDHLLQSIIRFLVSLLLLKRVQEFTSVIGNILWGNLTNFFQASGIFFIQTLPHRVKITNRTIEYVDEVLFWCHHVHNKIFNQGFNGIMMCLFVYCVITQHNTHTTYCTDRSEFESQLTTKSSVFLGLHVLWTLPSSFLSSPLFLLIEPLDWTLFLYVIPDAPNHLLSARKTDMWHLNLKTGVRKEDFDTKKHHVVPRYKYFIST